MQDHAALLNELRYSERLCLRTARLYRHLQACGVALSVMGGSATLTALASSVPPWVSVGGSLVFVAAGVAMMAVRPADKAALNEADAKRYASLRRTALTMDAATLAVALADLRPADAPEVESLRNPVYNDVVREIGADHAVVRLSLLERIVSAIA